ncbi:MAG: hypothetical protein AB8H79_19595 [Myxococcota bacterium]
MPLRFRHSLLLVSLIGTSTLCAHLAHATEPSAINVSDFKRVFGNMKGDIETQIKRNGDVNPDTIKRTLTNVNVIIDRIERSGADPAPFRKQIDDYLAGVQQRAGAAKRTQNEAKVSKTVPTVAPHPGIEAIAAGLPTWCDPILSQYEGQTITTTADIRLPDSPYSVQMSDLHFPLLFSCTLPDFAPTQGWTQAYRQRISNLLGFTAAENEAFMKRAAGLFKKGNVPRAKADIPARCETLPGKATGLIEARIGRDFERAIVGCGGASGPINMQFPNSGGRPLWLVDLPAGPSTELTKLGIASDLISMNLVNFAHRFDPYSAPDASKGQLIENYAMAHTIDMDTQGLWAEVDGLGLSGVTRFNTDVFIMGELRLLNMADRFVRDAAKDNPNLKAVFIDGADAGVAKYRAEAAASAKAMDLLLAIEDRVGPEVGGIDGCAEPLYAELAPWLKAQVQAQKITEPKDLRFQDHRGGILYQALMICGANDGTAPMMAHVFEETFWSSTNPQRGPISAAYQGMLDAYNEAVANPAPQAGGFSTSRGQAQTVIKMPQLHRNPVSPPTPTGKLGPSPHGMEKRGVIASIKPADGGFSELTFRTESVQRPIRDCKATNRIARIDDNGRLVPVYNCRTTGWQTVKVTNDPILLPGWLAANHKPGQLLVYRASQPFAYDKTPSWGWPLAAYSSASAKTPVSMFGVPLR